MNRRKRLHQFAAFQKDFADLRVHHQIDVALPVAQLDVRQPMPFFRKWQQVLGEESYFFDVNGKLSGTSTKQISTYSDVVAEIEQFVELESFFSDCIFLHVDLQPLSTLLQMSEPGLAHQSNRHQASGNAYGHAWTLQLLSCLVGVARDNLRNRVGKVVLRWISLLPESLDLFQFLAPQFVDFLVKCQRVPCLTSKICQSIVRVNKDYKQAARQSGGESDFQQIEVDGHAYDRICAQCVKVIDFLLCPDAAGHDQLPAGGAS